MGEFNVRGAGIWFEIYGIKITETIVNMWLVMLAVFVACLILTKKLKTQNIGKKQIIAETIVKIADKFTTDNMGKEYASMSPFVAAVFSLSIFCSLCSLIGFYPPTSDLSALFGWSLLVFAIITFTKIRANNLWGYIKSFTKPIAVLTPVNILSEFFIPVSMAFRHFGSIVSGSLIMSLLQLALAGFSGLLLGWVPVKAIAGFPLFAIGIPAVLSLYFDVFSGVLQAYIFCMLTVMNIKGASEKIDYAGIKLEKQRKKQLKKQKAQNKQEELAGAG